MSDAIDDIRESKGVLPKNLHWVVAVALMLAGLFVLYLNMQKENEAQQAKVEQQQSQHQTEIKAQSPNTKELIAVASEQAEQAEKEMTPSPDEADLTAMGDASSLSGEIVSARQMAQRDEAEERYARGALAAAPILVINAAPAQAAANATPSLEQSLLNNALNRRPPDVLSAQDKQLLQSVQAGGRPGSDALSAIASGDDGMQQAERNQSWYRQAQREAALGAQRQPIYLDQPVSPYTIVQGTPIPAVTVTPVNSDLPGQIVARTTTDVYDSSRQQHLLIPAGSSIYGSYNNAVIVDQDRLAVVFHRIIFPDGGGVTLGAMQGIDAAGQAGAKGEVDNHFWKMFGSAFMIAGISALVEPDNQGNNYYFSGGGSQANAGQILVDVTRTIQQRYTRIQPTVTVRAGERFNIMVQQDLSLAPYQGRVGS